MRGPLQLMALLIFAMPAAAADRDLSKDAVNAAGFSAKAPQHTVVAHILKAEVLLDRAQASPGVIDGKTGDNFKKAVTAFAETHGLPPATDITEDVWQALIKDAEPVLVDYTIDAQDVAGPFIGKVPVDYSKMAELPALAYSDSTQLLAAKFHMDLPLLKSLNPDADLSKAGTTIVVAAVKPSPITRKITRIDVDKPHGAVRALDAAGKLVVAYPATIGSDDTPSPSGSYKVRAIARNPTYTYDPDKNFKQGKNDKKLTIKPGPNNPVGTMFIALTKPTYGIHGTPDPAKIDKTGSHGCVRLTNWDAEQLGKAVRKGIPVTFIE